MSGGKSGFRRPVRFGQLSRADKRRAVINTAVWLVVVMFAFHGVITEFVASGVWLLTSIPIVLVLMAWGSVAFLRAGGIVGVVRVHVASSYIGVFVGFAMLVGLVTFPIVARSLPDIATRYLGEPGVRVAEFRKETSRAQRGCNHKVMLRFPGDRAAHRYCASAAQHDSLPYAGKLQVELRETWFGMHIVGISLVED